MTALSVELEAPEANPFAWHEAIRMVEAVSVPAALFWEQGGLGHVNAVAARCGLQVVDFETLLPATPPRAASAAGTCGPCCAAGGDPRAVPATGNAVVSVPLRVGELRLTMCVLTRCPPRPTTLRSLPYQPPLMQLMAPRYVRVADLMLSGRSDKEIAALLGLSYNTVRTYVRVVLRRAGAHSRAELISKALRWDRADVA